MNDKLQPFGHRESPYLRPNLNWQCSRADACPHGPSASGKCSMADRGCQPKRTVKSRRRLILLWLLCVSIAALTLFLTTSTLLTRLSPGPLSLSHAEVASCQDCHAAAGQSIGSWISVALRFGGHNDDQQCLSCHALGDNAFNPHSTQIERFAKPDSQASLTSPTHWKTVLAGKFRTWQAPKDDELSCSVCHREHQGELNAVADFDPQQCHTCHQNKFDLIETGHPEYSSFPHAEPSRIQFDHTSHLEKHFFEEEAFGKAPEGCTGCHNSDQTGEWMLTNSFEDTCSSCHLEDILGANRATSKGIAVLAIPELDIDSLNDAGLNIGHWPSWADGEVTPFMRTLLSQHDEQKALLKQALDSSIDLYDLSSASRDELIKAAKLAWEIKQLFYDLQIGGTQVMEQRLSTAFGGALDKSTLNRLVASLPRDTLVNNQQQWFPSLIEEMTSYMRGEIELLGPLSDVNNESQASSAKGISELDEAIAANVEEEGDEMIFSNDDSLDSDGDILGDDDDIFGGEEIILDDDSDIDFDLDDHDLLNEDDAFDVNEASVSTASNEASLQAHALTDNEAWALTGGWFRDGSVIRYRPADHADLFFKAWLDVASQQYQAIDPSLFNSLSSEQSVGNCAKCHSYKLDSSDAAPKYTMHWKSFKPNDVSVDFNRFSHVSHFSLMTDDGCTSCHTLNAEGAVNFNIDATHSNTSSLGSGFENMQRNTCTQCHQQGRAPDNCLTCHNYHAEPLDHSIDRRSDSLSSRARSAANE